MLLTWLESGDENQKRHAAHRLSLPDAASFAEGRPLPKLPPIPDNPTPAPGVRLGGCCGG